jgi:hypothetical protein
LSLRRIPLSKDLVSSCPFEFKVANTSVGHDGKKDQDDLLTLNTAYHLCGIFVDNDRYQDRIGKNQEKLKDHPDRNFVSYLESDLIRSRHVNFTFFDGEFVADIPGDTCSQLKTKVR